MESNQSEKLKRAQKKVKNLKDFYRHLRVYIVINILLLVVKLKAYNYFTEEGTMQESFFDWFEWNIIVTPVVWGLGLGVHALYVFNSKPLKSFKPKFYTDWEERQIEKYMNEENNLKD